MNSISRTTHANSQSAGPPPAFVSSGDLHQPIRGLTCLCISRLPLASVSDKPEPTLMMMMMMMIKKRRRRRRRKMKQRGRLFYGRFEALHFLCSSVVLIRQVYTHTHTHTGTKTSIDTHKHIHTQLHTIKHTHKHTITLLL